MTTEAPTTEQLRAVWDTLAPGYDEFVAPLASACAQAIIGEFGIRSGLRFLDVGAGVGALATPAARLGAQVIAVDFAPAMIDRLVARAAAEGLSALEGLVMDGQALDLADDSVDHSASLNGVSLFADPREGLGELVRVTRPGGQVTVAAFGASPAPEWVRFFRGAVHAALPGVAQPVDIPAHADRFSDPGQLRRELTEAGLTGVRVAATEFRTRFRSAQHLWDVVMFADPTGTRLTPGLTDRQLADTQRVLDGMLRERSGGHPGAVLRAEITVATGTKPSRGPTVPAHSKEKRS